MLTLRTLFVELRNCFFYPKVSDLFSLVVEGLCICISCAFRFGEGTVLQNAKQVELRSMHLNAFTNTVRPLRQSFPRKLQEAAKPSKLSRGVNDGR